MSPAAVAKNSSAQVQAGDHDFYIPPSGLAFRLIGYSSNCAVFSRNSQEPAVGHYEVSHGAFEDQWFTLLRGTGNHAGLYAIKGRKSGKVLYSRREKDPRAWHIEGDGKYEDNWFKIEPGKGQYATCFRLITASEDMALFSRTSEKPYYYNWGTEHGIYADQHFTFLWEDMQVDKIEYKLDAGKIASSTPIGLYEQTLQNDSDNEQQMSFKVNESVTNSSSFEFSTGFTISVGMEFKGGIPMVSEGKFKVSSETKNTWNWGKSTSITKTYTVEFPIKAGPHQTLVASSMVNQGILKVPFTMHLSSKRDPSIKVQTHGEWNGVSSWDLRYSIRPVQST